MKGPDIEIDGGRILLSRVSCTQDAVVFRKINGVWSSEGELVGDATECPAGFPTQSLDISGTRAMVVTTMPNPEESYVRTYRLNSPGTGWSREHGDIRVAHFAGLHALQMLSRVALVFAGRGWPETRLRRSAACQGLSAAVGVCPASVVVERVAHLRSAIYTDEEVRTR